MTTRYDELKGRDRELAPRIATFTHDEYMAALLLASVVYQRMRHEEESARSLVNRLHLLGGNHDNRI